MQASGKTKHLGDDLEAVGVEAVAMNKLRDGDVALGRQGRKQVEALKHEADFVAPQFCARGIA